LKYSRIHRFEKDIEVSSTTNNIWNIRERFTKQQTQRQAPVNQGRKGLTHTPLSKATSVAEVQEDQFRAQPEEQNFNR
jgi:hypothetical protein